MIEVTSVVSEALKREWKANSVPQKTFLALPDSIFEALYGGAAGGGKSDSLMMLPIAREFYTNPTYKGLFLRRTFKQLEDEIIPRSREWYEAAGARYNESKKVYKWPNGAMLAFGHCEHEKDIRSYDSAEYNTVCFDELTSFTEFMYKYLFTRCRSKDSRLPSIIRSGTNPGNIGHGWVRKRFIDAAIKGYTILIERRKNKDGVEREYKRIFIPAKVSDNINLLQNDPSYIANLELLDEAERKAKLEGDWYTFAGQVFEEFRSERFEDEPENAVHKIPSFIPPLYLPRILSIDWGKSANNVVGMYAVYPNKRVIKYKEDVCTGQNITEWAPRIARMCQGQIINSFVLDPSAWQDRGLTNTIKDQIDEILYPAIGIHPERAINDRVGGKNLIHEYLRWKPRDIRFEVMGEPDLDYADMIFRQRGQKAYDIYINAFKPDIEDQALPRFLITEDCPETLRVLPLCVYDKTRVEDVAEFEGDDAYDETRYALYAANKLFSLAGKNETPILRQAKLEEELAASNNQTKYYRELERLERKKDVFGVRRRSVGRRR